MLRALPRALVLSLAAATPALACDWYDDECPPPGPASRVTRLFGHSTPGEEGMHVPRYWFTAEVHEGVDQRTGAPWVWVGLQPGNAQDRPFGQFGWLASSVQFKQLRYAYVGTDPVPRTVGEWDPAEPFQSLYHDYEYFGRSFYVADLRTEYGIERLPRVRGMSVAFSYNVVQGDPDDPWWVGEEAATVDLHVTPEPATLALTGGGLAALALVARRRRRS